MDDLISRQAAIDAMCAINDKYNENPHIDAIIDAIEALPSAQPERKKGKWIRTDCGFDVECKCSVCGYRDFVPQNDTYWFKRFYCPYCGADMRGEKDG